MLPLDSVDDSPISPLADRLFAGVVLVCAAGFVWFLMQVIPDPRGHGTHEQLGLPACGWVVHHGIPCPTCGVTTSASLLVRLRLFQAVETQPFGASLAGFGLWLAAVAGWCLVRRRSFLDYLQRLQHFRILVWGIALLLASWLYVYLTFTP